MNNRPLPKHIQLQGRTNYLRVERGITSSNKPCWRLWLAANSDFTLGHFIELRDGGRCTRVTWHEDGTESEFEL